jgi:hypothetical protein
MQRELVFAVEVEIDSFAPLQRSHFLALNYTVRQLKGPKGFIFHSIAMDVLFYLKV